jgi:hypothetical protein
VRRISLDALLLAALAAAGIAEALGDDTLTSSDRVTGVVATVLAVVLLAYRRRAPVAVFVAVGVLCGAWVAIAYGWEQGPSRASCSSWWRPSRWACTVAAAPRSSPSSS